MCVFARVSFMCMRALQELLIVDVDEEDYKKAKKAWNCFHDHYGKVAESQVPVDQKRLWFESREADDFMNSCRSLVGQGKFAQVAKSICQKHTDLDKRVAKGERLNNDA